jgi:pimeloyl-ACP methyl ester carboxylesterase
MHASFTSLKQIEAGVLNVGYAEAGPTDGPAVILLHGWPYDIYSFVDVTPLLASKGYHVIVPYLRGYGPTTFLPSANMRNAHRFARPKRCPEWNQSADGARLPQTWRCRESAGCYLGEIPH